MFDRQKYISLSFVIEVIRRLIIGRLPEIYMKTKFSFDMSRREMLIHLLMAVIAAFVVEAVKLLLR